MVRFQSFVLSPPPPPFFSLPLPFRHHHRAVTWEERDIGIRQTGLSLQLQIDLHPDIEKLTYPWRVNP